MPQVPIDPSRTALVFFDMLNCYVHPPDAEKKRRILATGVVDRCVEMGRAARLRVSSLVAPSYHPPA